MATVFVSKQFIHGFGDQLKAVAEAAGKNVDFLEVPNKPLSQADCDRIDGTFLDRDIRFDPEVEKAFDRAMGDTRSCRWMHTSSSGVNPAPFLEGLANRGGIYTTSTGSNAEPVAQTGLTGLLMLARGFAGRYVPAQAKRDWNPLRGPDLPNDLRGQTLLLLGVGAIGRTLAGYARALGLKVVGVRRSPRTPNDPVDELHHPSQLPELWPRADWIVVTCPLTEETRNMVSADAFGRMKRGVRLVNIARGEIVDEAALIEALRSGHVGGAHLDAHVTEPLPADSPLWAMPNVVVTPHNASASTGNEKRSAEVFIENFGRWIRGEPMLNVQKIP